MKRSINNFSYHVKMIPFTFARYMAFYCFSFFAIATSAQSLPVIQATARQADIRDGAVYQQRIWNLSPEIRPDTYFVREPADVRRVTFYTDKDSISFMVSPGKNYDFVTLLNGKDSCFIRISAVKPARDDPYREIPLIGLQQDFNIFRKALENDHPGLNRYLTPQQTSRLFDNGYAGIRHPMNALEFGKIILSVLSQIHDGHTGTNMTRLITGAYGDSVRMFPLNIYFIRDKAYLLCDGEAGLKAGTRVLTVNGVPVTRLRLAMFNYLPSDGEIDTKKQQTLNNGAFPFLYRWLYGDKATFNVSFEAPGHTLRHASVKALLAKDFPCDKAYNVGGGPNLQFSNREDGIAIMRIKTFDNGRLSGGQALPAFLDSSFRLINSAKVKKLVIDLRGNAGGDDANGALLYAYLTAKPFGYFKSITTKDRKWTEKDDSLLKVQQPRPQHFDGKVFFLIDGSCFSTTADFCAIAKSNRRGVFIGQETGGGYYGNTSGYTKKVDLPNSKLSITIPRLKYVNSVRPARFKDRGVVPDYNVLPSAYDLLSNKDTALDFALNLMAGK